MTDSSGTVVWAADYKPFGETTITISTITNNLRFPGQYFDAETGLHYNYLRDYNPALDRYIESDPIGVSPSGSRGGFNNLYIYASSNPLRYTDSRGLKPCDELANCMACFKKNGGPNLQMAASSVTVECDASGKDCPDYAPDCFGHAIVGSNKAFITNKPGNPKSTCWAILHEIAHAYAKINDEQVADAFANNNMPGGCGCK